jgi:hypothetical protein
MYLMLPKEIGRVGKGGKERKRERKKQGEGRNQTVCVQ